MVRSSQYSVGKLSRGERHRAGTMRTLFPKRRRRHGLQGRPTKMPELRHLLFQWFVDVRSSVKSRLRNRVALTTARGMIKDIQGAALREGRLLPVPPNIDHPLWLRRWQMEFGISLKHPTRRFKISRGKCKRRTRNAIVNSHIARQAFVLLYGGSNECDVSVGCRCRVGRRGRVGCRRSRGLPQECMVISLDQKGCYFNRSESKNTTTLHHTGSRGPVDLKTNHAQSRSRFSMTTNMALRAPWRVPPFGLHFKGETDRTIRDLHVPEGVPMILTFSPSGSYPEEAFLLLLDRVLPDWSEERERMLDYGLLHLDAYTVHKMESVRELARRKRFIIGGTKCSHEGGVTGITQWNDLDCHNVIEARLIALEEDDFHEQLTLRPNRVPTRTRQAVLSDCAAIWTTFAHDRMTAASAVRSGLGVALPEKLPSGYMIQ